MIIRVSRIKSSLEEIYNGNTLLSNNDKEKLTTFNLCIGKSKRGRKH